MEKLDGSKPTATIYIEALGVAPRNQSARLVSTSVGERKRSARPGTIP